jgi:hypothetical protein
MTQELVPSFVADRSAGDHWAGAIYAMRKGLGPELVMQCVHHHRSMHVALDCAESELAWAKRVVAMADQYRDVAP